MEDFSEYDVGNQELIDTIVAEMTTEGLDCAAVDLLLKMAKEGDELLEVADVLGGITLAGHAQWAGEILRMVMWRDQDSGQDSSARSDPDYRTSAILLSYLVDNTVELAQQMVPHMVVYTANGPDCYDFAFAVGHMVKSRKTPQAAKLLFAIYSDESEEGKNFQSLVPCLLGTMIDFQHSDWATDLVWQLCNLQGLPDYSVAGWCLAQHVFFGRPDWAAMIIYGLNRQPAAGYQENLLESVTQWGGAEYASEIRNALRAF